MSFPFFAAIDPVFLIFPENIAIIISNLRHPHEPSVADIQRALEALTAEQRAAVASRARALGALARVTEEALNGLAADEAA